MRKKTPGVLAVGLLGYAAGFTSAALLAGPAPAAAFGAAVLAGWAGALWAVASLAASCVIAAVIVVTLPVPDRPARARRRRGGGALSAIWRRPPLAAVTAASTVSQLCLGALPIVAALLATGLHGPAMTGLTLSAFAVGNLVSSLAYARLPLRRLRPETVVAAGVVARWPYRLRFCRWSTGAGRRSGCSPRPG